MIHHPVQDALIRMVGRDNVLLVGSRAFRHPVTIDGKAASLWNDKSDWDFYVGAEKLADVIPQLERVGFKPMPGGGPYGEDQLTYGVWRLAETAVFGIEYPSVDVIVMSPHQLEYRRGVWENLVRLGARGGRLCRAMKNERTWGAFWWLHGAARDAR